MHPSNSWYDALPLLMLLLSRASFNDDALTLATPHNTIISLELHTKETIIRCFIHFVYITKHEMFISFSNECVMLLGTGEGGGARTGGSTSGSRLNLLRLEVVKCYVATVRYIASSPYTFSAMLAFLLTAWPK